MAIYTIYGIYGNTWQNKPINKLKCFLLKKYASKNNLFNCTMNALERKSLNLNIIT